MEKYLNHYLAVPGILWFAVCSVLVTAVVHIILAVFSGRNRHRMFNYMEMYDELVYSATAMLFFIGLFFLVSYRYFEIPEHFYKIWDQYEDYILLAVLFGAIVIINIIDTLLVPLRTITGEQKASLRIIGMLYMLAVFAYIKWIYLDNNYDSIISYFIIMVIGRFVYFDASFKDFCANMKKVFRLIPLLLLMLATSGALAWYGFGSGYLWKKNGVVLSLGIAHLFVIILVSVIHHIVRIFIKSRRSYINKSSRKESIV